MDTLPSDSEFLQALVGEILAEIDPEFDVDPSAPAVQIAQDPNDNPTTNPE